MDWINKILFFRLLLMEHLCNCIYKKYNKIIFQKGNKKCFVCSVYYSEQLTVRDIWAFNCRLKVIIYINKLNIVRYNPKLPRIFYYGYY